jgi:FkbM family methyltransferase
MRRAVGDSGYVIGIEPQNYLYDYLVAGFGRNSNVEFYNCALSDSVGTAKLTTPIHDGRPVPGHASLSHSPEEGLEEIVSIARLDDVLDGRRPKFIKIDVEGHELSVLRGGDLALQSKPVLVVEMCDYKIGGASARTFAHLTKYYEYHAKILSQNRVLQPLPAWPPESRLNTPNVVFLPDWA